MITSYGGMSLASKKFIQGWDNFFLALPTLGEARLVGAAVSIKRLLFMKYSRER